MTMSNDSIAWVEGKIIPAAEARVPALDHGLLFGDGVFEGIRVTDRGLFRLDDHMKRLETAGRAVGIGAEAVFDRAREAACETTRAFGRQEGYLRLIVTRGVGALGIDPATCPEPAIVCIAAGALAPDPEREARGLSLVTSSLRRPPADVLDPRVKSLNYLNNVLAKREARQRGADEALVLNAAGRVAEASVANLFAVRDGVLRTPPSHEGCLEGITRASVLEMAEAAGFATRETPLCRMDLLSADEVFLTGTGARLVPVASLDGAAIGRAEARPVFARLVADFPAFAAAHGTRI